MNLSTRVRVETGDKVMIGGFIISGNVSKPMVLRGIAPSLVNFDLPAGSVLDDPVLELRRQDESLITSNDNWINSPQRDQIKGTIFEPKDEREAVIMASLEPGSYTVILSGAHDAKGIAVVEMYDNDQTTDSSLGNISTRGFVRTGDDVMIGGFSLGGNPGKTNIAIRGLGASLEKYGIKEFLPDPALELHNAHGAILASNNDWTDDPVSATELSLRGFALEDAHESGIFISLSPGQFTVIMTDHNGDVGIGLVEIYNLK